MARSRSHSHEPRNAYENAYARIKSTAPKCYSTLLCSIKTGQGNLVIVEKHTDTFSMVHTSDRFSKDAADFEDLELGA
jgi:hypothetical protein